MKNTLNMVYGLGASVVITGALFKILHLKGANEMLIIGMVTEAVVFLIFAFDFPSEGEDWTRVYPHLDPEYEGDAATGSPQLDMSWTNEMAKLDGAVFEELSGTLAGLNDNVEKLSSVTDAAGATNEYTERIREATGKIDSLNQSYSVAVDSMSSFSDAASDAQAYHEQIQIVTRNLSSLNSIYELELQDSKTHLKSLNQFYASMTEAMSSMSEASADAEAYRHGMKELSTNISKLNTVYGNMLSAMAGGAS